jgi:methionyl-tRNA formyltransferase
VTYRSVFFGTPTFAVPALQALARVTEVVGVVCQPDRRGGRGMKLGAPPVKQAAIAVGLPVYQPERVRSGELERWLLERGADFALVAAYGRILPKSVLGAPRRGCLNLHASILPQYRGAAPIAWALLDGQRETGISLMQMDEGMDTGAVYAVRRLGIRATETAGTLTDALANLAAEMVGSEVLAAVEGRLSAVPQDETLATNAPPIDRDLPRIDWSRSSEKIVRQVQAFAPTPGAFTFLAGRRLKVLEARDAGPDFEGAPGTVSSSKDGLLAVACGDGSVFLERLQMEGGKPLSGRDLLNGRVTRSGQVLGGAEPVT